MSPQPAPDRTILRIEPEDTYALRHRTLRPEQPREACHFPGDASEGAFHLGSFDGGILVAVASFNPEAAPACLDGLVESLETGSLNQGGVWRLRGMATAPESRGQGHGSALLRAGFAELEQRGGRLLWCNARLSAADFYLGLGLARAGEDFEIPGIGGHVVMWRALASF
jgi:GNAT superfamily N-acetyltransferase